MATRTTSRTSKATSTTKTATAASNGATKRERVNLPTQHGKTVKASEFPTITRNTGSSVYEPDIVNIVEKGQMRAYGEGKLNNKQLASLANQLRNLGKKLYGHSITCIPKDGTLWVKDGGEIKVRGPRN